MRSLLLTVSVALILVGPAACGDDDDSGGDKPAQQESSQASGGGAPGSADTPEAAFASFHSALAEGDADAVCGALAPSAVKQTQAASVGGSCEDWVKEIASAYDDAAKAKLRAAKPRDVAIDGNKATIKYTAPVLGIPVTIEAEKSGSTWKLTKLSEGV